MRHGSRPSWSDHPPFPYLWALLPIPCCLLCQFEVTSRLAYHETRYKKKEVAVGVWLRAGTRTEG